MFEFHNFFYLNPASVEFAGDNLNSFKIVYAGFRLYDFHIDKVNLYNLS